MLDTNGIYRPGRPSRWKTAGTLAAVALTLASLTAWQHATPVTGVSAAESPKVTILPGGHDGVVTSYAPVVEKAAPAVVTVRTERKARSMPTGGQMPESLLPELFGPQFRGPRQQPA